ncbi:MAG: 50S ribosomal protein L35 [Candidatus Harrisonbacteria bacterium]|nr:50S ribosomal protein L35 [Candidatus Harrisonbacteria bacterium]
MKKSVSKRIKVTGSGKLIRRKMAQGHFRSKKSGNKRRAKGNTLNVEGKDLVKHFNNYLVRK